MNLMFKKLTIVLLLIAVTATAFADLIGKVTFEKPVTLATKDWQPFEFFRVTGYDKSMNVLFTQVCSGSYFGAADKKAFEVKVRFVADERAAPLLGKLTKLVVVMTALDEADPTSEVTGSFEVTDKTAISLTPVGAQPDPYKFAVTPSIGFSTFFGGAIADHKNDDYSPATTAYIHFPLGKEFSDSLLRGFLKNPKTTRLAISLGTPLSGARTYIIGPTLLWGSNRFATTLGFAFANHGSNGRSNRRIGWGIGVSYSIGTN